MQEKLFFLNSKGNKLCGILSNPSNNINPVIILCHGHSTSKNSSTHLKLEKILNENNLSTFRIDFYGHGESEGKFEDVTISEAKDDILNAIKFLKKIGYKKLGLVGSSFGGIASIMAASKTNDLFVLALKSPVSNYTEIKLKDLTKKGIEDWKNKKYIDYIKSNGKKLKLNYIVFEDSKNNNGYEAAKKISIPTLIVHGDEDEKVPIQQSIKISKIIKNCKLEIIKDADHSYSNPEHFNKMIKLISKFIIKNSKK